MKLSLISFTDKGAALEARLAGLLAAAGYEMRDICTLGGAVRDRQTNLRDWTRLAFAESGALVFIGACGIAVRAVAPYVKDKFTDPAVIAVDEQGRFVIPLLSGHVGGANMLASEIAALIDAVPVISTATDINGTFAVDTWAAQQGLYICERTLAKEISAALLAGCETGFASDFPVDGALPAGIAARSAKLGICISLDTQKQPFDRTLHLVPRIVTIGVGCRKGVTEDAVEQAVTETLSASGVDIAAAKAVASIDLKAREAGLTGFCEVHGLPFTTFTAERLNGVRGEFSASAFVSGVTGVDNVCERAAVLASGGTLIIRKQCAHAVTVAAAAENWRVCFGH